MCVYYLYRYSIFLYTYSCNIYIYIHTYMYIHLYSGSAIHVHIEMEFLQNPQIWSKAFLQGHREATTDGFLFWCRKWQVDALIRYIRIYVWRYTVYIHICVKIHVLVCIFICTYITHASLHTHVYTYIYIVVFTAQLCTYVGLTFNRWKVYFSYDVPKLGRWLVRGFFQPR